VRKKQSEKPRLSLVRPPPLGKLNTIKAIRIKFLFAWYDMWIGAYWDRADRRLYILPLPMVGIVVQF